MKAPQRWYVRPAVRESCGSLRREGDLTMVVVEIARMRGDDPVGAGLHDRRLHELDELEVRDGVHLDVREGAENRLTHAENLRGLHQVGQQVVVAGVVSTGGHLAARDHGSDDVTFCREPRGAATESEYVVVRVCHRNQEDVGLTHATP